MRSWRIKFFNWEYWSFGMVYTWIYPAWLFLCLRARSLFFFSAANPSIKNGGFLGESKKDIHAIMPRDLYPGTLHFEASAAAEEILLALRNNGFEYPLIGKPDNGGRGRGVKQLTSDADVINYSLNTVVPFHIQKFITLPMEAGFFYYRMPGEASGRLSGIVSKEFLSVTGNGTSSIAELLMQNDRYVLQLRNLERMYGAALQQVLPAGEKKILVPYGNHARGALFLDHSFRIDERLTRVIDDICRQVDDFYFGRLDIRFNSWEELKEGRNYCVIEVNGAGSEPTHIYDPSHSLFFAWKEIIRHWILLWRISRKNHRRGFRYLTWKEGVQMFREDREHSKKLAAMPV